MRKYSLHDVKLLAAEMAEFLPDGADFEARQIFIAAAGFLAEGTSFLPSEFLADEHFVDAAVSRRKNGEPLQYILGSWEFMGLPFAVGEGVLIPRQDTESLVEVALDLLKENSLVADLCCGSGCIGISLSALKGIRSDLFDISEKALSYAKKNVALNKVEDKCRIFRSDLLVDLLPNKYDAILSNPPYLSSEDMDNLQREVTFEPSTALFGGNDGLHFYRTFIPLHKHSLRDGGLFAVECGLGQAEIIKNIFYEYDFSDVTVRKDLCGVDRIVYAIK